MSTPYIGFGNETLLKMPVVADGAPIICPHCSGTHKLKSAVDKGGEKTGLLMFFRCAGKDYLGAVSGRLTAGITPDCSGRI